MGKALNYVPPTIREGTFIVQIEAEDTREQEIYWSTALIAYVLGDNPYKKSMDNYVTNVWNFVEKPQILYHDEGYYIFRFQNIEERDLVLQAGTYTYHNKPLILQHWSMDFKFDPRITVEMEKVSYARVLVEADVSHPLPDSFEMQTPKGVINQQIEYDWKPNFCFGCIRFGHNSNQCWLKENQEMVEKFKEQPKRRRNKEKQNKTNLKWLPKEHKGNEAGPSGVQTEMEKQPMVETEGCNQVANDKHDEPDQKSQDDRANVKGKDIQQKELRLFLRKYKVDFIGCLETTVKEKKATRILKQAARDWRACCNYNAHPNGRIWLLWKSNINVQVLVVEDQFIHCEIQEISSNFKAMVTVVYASNDINQRNQLWRKLIQIGANIQDSWLLSGDFNNVLHTDDRIGAPITQAETQGFQDMINTLQLSQVKSSGWYYTWCNKQQPDKRVYSRIDWALGNFDWLQQYNHIALLPLLL
ncbi:PREDICTED: uncharacterized protein LOC109215406 [Nicotiana attenuata]|uniref:uncharacterized protein LOC109215406 n=1 Tax=Nicotiana attenuata TaxID=49451 RepID=UPI0009057725|nr:PREDICTED: uncharacterized protein LOC109215406 [Nicotiana attenuata]